MSPMPKFYYTKGSSRLKRLKEKKPCISTCIKTGVEEEHKSLTQAAIKLDVHRSNISFCCAGQRKQTGGYKFRFL